MWCLVSAAIVAVIFAVSLADWRELTHGDDAAGPLAEPVVDHGGGAVTAPHRG